MSLIGPHSPLRRLRDQKRFVADKLRILVLRERYHVQEECRQALKALGHEVIDVWVGQAPQPQAILRAVLNACAVWRPDMLISINAFGFDRAHWLGETLEAIGLPTAIWFVDSPTFILRGWLPLGLDRNHLFVWDRSYVPYLKQLGAQNVHHLPLAASLTRKQPPAAESSTTLQTSFVGGSLRHAPVAWATHLSLQQCAQAQSWVPKLDHTPHALFAMAPRPGPPVCAEVMMQGFAQAHVSHSRRYTALKAATPLGLEVFGDSGWAEVLPLIKAHGKVGYGAELDAIYRQTQVSLNVTSAQMPEGVNQRVFDVPQAGGFLLSDNQPELGDYFELGREIATFKSPDELVDKALFFLKRPLARARMVTAAQKRIARNHLFTHRLSTLIEVVKHAHRPNTSVAWSHGPRAQAQAQKTPSLL